MAGYRRFFTNKIENNLVIEGEEFRHAVSVLRIKEGETIIVCDNSGDEYLAQITKIEKKCFNAQVIQKQENNCEAKNEVILICGYLKGDKTELIVQKAVELGVKKIITFSSEFSSAYMNENKLSRLNRVSVESAKQCGRAIAPTVEYAETFEKALTFGEGATTKIFACEFADKSDISLSEVCKTTAIVVGSEGGFSKEESDLAVQKGYKRVFLGNRILRAETACIALCSIVMHSLGELK